MEQGTEDNLAASATHRLVHGHADTHQQGHSALRPYFLSADPRHGSPQGCRRLSPSPLPLWLT